jgi:hypothetical protein
MERQIAEAFGSFEAWGERVIGKEVSNLVCGGSRPDEAIAAVARTAREQIGSVSGVTLTVEETERVVRRSYLTMVEAALGNADFMTWQICLDAPASILVWIDGEADLVPVAIAALCLDDVALAKAAAAYWGTAADDEDGYEEATS